MLLYFTVALMVGILIRNQNLNNRYYRKYFVIGLVVKMLGGIAFGLATIVLNLGIQVNELPRRLGALVKGEKELEKLEMNKCLQF